MAPPPPPSSYHQSSSSSYTSSSFTSSSSTSSSNYSNPRTSHTHIQSQSQYQSTPTGGTIAQHSYTDPTGRTTVTEARALPGESATYQQRSFGGGRAVEGGSGSGAGAVAGGLGRNRLVEDVTEQVDSQQQQQQQQQQGQWQGQWRGGDDAGEADRKYREAMEEEYAKREGGA